MFFSVIVPVYKVEKYLRNCVDSILCQTFGDFEIILVDDGSPDSCPQICDEYAANDTRIKVVHKENGGLASARKAGIEVATGKYVYNLDSDDTIEPDTFEYAHKIICETDCDILTFAYKWMKNGVVTAITTDCADEGLYDGADIKSKLFPELIMDKDMNHLSCYLSGKAIKRQLLTPNQLNVDSSISLGEDLCCVFPCYLQAESVYISKKPTYLYTVNDNSISKNVNAEQIVQIGDVADALCRLDMDKPHDFEEQLSRYFCFMCFAVLAAAAESRSTESFMNIKKNIDNSANNFRIKAAKFDCITKKSRITIFLMKHNMLKMAFDFLRICNNIKSILKKG